MPDRDLIIKTLEEKISELSSEQENAVKISLFDNAAKCQHQIEVLNWALICVKTL